ncbi:hypothetical protein C8R44DRAFT_865021 [Mycena epipterygia]|nr:hypothetical protein C8R44DRAFT_865021 [Mycena epipterygia]
MAIHAVAGILTHNCGHFPRQRKVFWDTTSTPWATSALAGDYSAGFVSTRPKQAAASFLTDRFQVMVF